MKRAVVFRIMCLLSLLVAGAAACGWLTSFWRDTAIINFNHGGEQWTLKSSWGQLALFGPPPGDESTASMTSLAAKISNADFDWGPAIKDRRFVFVQGAVRQDSPTWRLYQHLSGRKRNLRGLEAPIVGEMAKSIDDPERFAAAHLLVASAMSERREIVDRFAAQNWIDHFYTMSETANSIPRVFMRANQGIIRESHPEKMAPDFSLRLDLRPEVQALMQERRGGIFYGWIFLTALILPLAWVARPRWRERTRRRWLGNWVALASFMLCVPSVGLWVRSYWVYEQFMFERRPLRDADGTLGKAFAYRWMSSSQGLVKVLEYSGSFGFTQPVGYLRTPTGLLWMGKPSKTMIVGELYTRLPGIEYYRLPLAPSPRVLAAKGTPVQSPGGEMGERWLAVAWWVIVLLTAIAPALWTWQASIWLIRRWREKKAKHKTCSKCGYDMRATPLRCPECGNIFETVASEKATGEAPVPH